MTTTYWRALVPTTEFRFKAPFGRWVVQPLTGRHQLTAIAGATGGSVAASSLVDELVALCGTSPCLDRRDQDEPDRGGQELGHEAVHCGGGWSTTACADRGRPVLLTRTNDAPKRPALLG